MKDGPNVSNWWTHLLWKFLFGLYIMLLETKFFRLHAILYDAAGAVRSHFGKGPGYCYLIGQGPNSCLLGHVTELFSAFT